MPRASWRSAADVRIPLLHAWRFNIPVSVAIAIADSWSVSHGAVWGEWLAFAWFAFYGIYCLQNFAACREVHCAVTGPGFSLAAVFAISRVTGLAHFDPLLPWTIFAAAACAGWIVEYVYERRYGSTFLGKKPDG